MTNQPRSFLPHPHELAAIVNGTLREVRRPANPPESLIPIWERFPNQEGGPFGKPGDVLCVKEKWACVGEADHLKASELNWENTCIFYATAQPHAYVVRSSSIGAYNKGVWRSATQMPHWASRYSLKVAAVRVEKTAEGWDWVAEVAVDKPGKDA